VVTDVSTSGLTLTWDRSTDNIAVAGYKIYRDGIRIGFSQTNSFVDKMVEPAAGYAYNVTAYDTAFNESPLSVTLTVLLGYWKFDERRGVTAIDSSGLGNNGTIVGPKRVPMAMGFALDFDGRDYVEISANTDLDNLDAVTMSAWIYPHADSHWHVLDKGDGDKRIYSEGVDNRLDGRVRYTDNQPHTPLPQCYRSSIRDSGDRFRQRFGRYGFSVYHRGKGRSGRRDVFQWID